MQEIMDMRVIGIDTGTTTISGVLVEDGRLTDSVTLKNDTKKESDGYRLQDADRILEHCISVLKRLHAEKADGIALTGQMHGIVYTDAEGHACSDAVSWQDERGNRLYRDQMTYSAYMSRFTGYPAASGYGMVTLFHDTVNGQIPAGAVSFCTIPDYIAMRLCQRKKPLIHTSMAQSLGLYDQRTKGFDLQAADILGLNKQYLPAVTDTVCILGTYQGSIPVLCALGDNQASVYGACAGRSRLLVNIGTGSQISLICDTYRKVDGLDTRPYVDGQYLLSGSSLCGGSAYDVLARLVADTLQYFGHEVPEDLLQRLDTAAMNAAEGSGLIVDTRFLGTRIQPELTGRITGINTANMTLGALAYAFADGVVKELYDFYELMPDKEEAGEISVSGNAVRNSELYRMIIRKYFPDRIIHTSKIREEAAYGAARYAADRVLI